MLYLWPALSYEKKLASAFFVFASKSTFEVLTTPTPLYDSWGTLKKSISQGDHVNPFLISRISPNFEKFYAERRKIRIFFKNILVALYLTVYEGWGNAHFRKNFSLLLVSIPIWAFWFPAENRVTRRGTIIQSYPARAFYKCYLKSKSHQ